MHLPWDRLEAPDRRFVGHRDIMTRSLARYHFVMPHLKGITADVGCGRGYGLDVIRPRSAAQIGLDVSQRFLRDARAGLSSVPLVNASGDALPFPGGALNSIISFDVIEHIEDDVGFLNELRRVAGDNAFVAISTPNALVSSGGAGKPLDPFHIREYSSAEFHALLRKVFASVCLFGQSERTETDGRVRGRMNSLIDRIPVRHKYLLPACIQDLLSVALRPRLRLDECRFETSNLDNAHTFIALCHP